MALKDILAIDRETLLFAKKETTFGVGVKPGAADQVLIAGEGRIRQARGYITDAQKRNTLSMLSRIAGRFEPGEATIPVYIKPSGTAGTKPEGAQIYEGLFGREVINAGVDVRYKLLLIGGTRPSLTLWFKQGHFVYMAWGTIFGRMSAPIRAGNTDDAVAQMALTAFFAELRWTGTDLANETITTIQTDLTVVDARKFTVGSFIQKKDQSTGAINDNAGAGFQVTAVNYTTNVLTITPGITNTNPNDIIQPWLPTGTELGDPVHGRLGLATRGGINLPLLSSEIILDNKIKMLNEEKNALDFPNRFIHATARDVNINTDVYFDANVSKFFHESKESTQADVTIPIGNVAGKQVKFVLKNVELNPPDVSGAEEKIMRLEGVAFASASFDDELEMVFD